MTAIARRIASFEAAFGMAYEEEISGIGYFDALSQIEPNPRCAVHLVKECDHLGRRKILFGRG